ncbi:MAG: hypothetical protein HY996_09755 [Micrococcales bacterium]|nr:hypothetical protein [Micrococcales bacterium]
MSAEQPAEDRSRVRLADVVVAVIVGFLFAVAVYGAIGNLIGLPQLLGAARIPVPWVPLIAGVALPIALYVGALMLGRGRTSFARTLILIVALAANSALGLTLYFVTLVPF